MLVNGIVLYCTVASWFLLGFINGILQQLPLMITSYQSSPILCQNLSSSPHGWNSTNCDSPNSSRLRRSTSNPLLEWQQENDRISRILINEVETQESILFARQCLINLPMLFEDCKQFSFSLPANKFLEKKSTIVFKTSDCFFDETHVYIGHPYFCELERLLFNYVRTHFQ